MTHSLGRRSILVALAATLLCVFPGGEVRADTADQLKQAGVAGERPDGYLGLVDPHASDAVKQNIKDINRKRRQKYQSIADKNGADRAVIEKLSGTKLIERALAGQYILSGGKWVRK